MYDVFSKVYIQQFVAASLTTSGSPGTHPLPIVNSVKMAPRPLKLLPLIFCLVIMPMMAYAQDTNHFRPRDPPLGTLSKYNERTKLYEPVSAE
jgi:hypothetical protein